MRLFSWEGRRRSFTSVRELKQQIELFVQRYNADATPFQWVAAADSILQKIERIAKRISATGHQVRPFIIVLAGVNGAGKTSVLSALLQEQGLDCFNPDRFAAELASKLVISLQEANGLAWQQGRAMLEEAIAGGTNFAFETTLGGRTIARLLQRASQSHDVTMLYCGLSSPQMHIARVAQRVAHQGHPIPEEKIRERWTTSRSNLIGLLPSLAHLQVFDNSRSVEPGQEVPDPELVLELGGGRVLFPDVRSARALAAVPEWAQPILEAAIQLQQRV